ncbi:Sorting nexin-24, partial [Pteropus alecto]
VFKIEVLMNGRKHFVEKRYSEFHALHKKLKKCIKTPEIPSKHVRNWVPKVLEQRRQGLETYLQLKKCIKTPEIPSKHVRNWVPKVLEQRRQGLETYLQAVILENEELPKLFLDFLNVRRVPSLPKAESCGSFDETEFEEPSVFCLPSSLDADMPVLDLSSKLSHQPVLLFLRDPYVLPAASGNQTCHLLTALY